MKIVSVVGARPNFMKIAPFIRAIEAHNACPGQTNPIEHLLVHTGQHYDDRMSTAFFEALGIPAADINLGIGSGTHAEQVGRTMIEFEKVLKEHRPDWVVVVGDVNATCACSITAKKEQIRVAHIEAGLRSFDMAMPEEINRLVTDRLADLLFTPDEISNGNLRDEGVAEERIRFVGNIMIDTLEANRDQAAALELDAILRDNALDSSDSSPNLEASEAGYAVMTMHRPSNVDSSEILTPIIDFILNEVCADMPVIWPIHPRARKQLEAFGLWEKCLACPNLVLLHPLGYHDLLRLNMDARIMLTDSGGLQEECCVLGTPCLTLRWNTERPVTLQEHGGASVLVGNSIERIRCEYRKTLTIERRPQSPPLWDGDTARRIVEVFAGLA
jgi:UDP-N-acetylglucosamine 2-epimerase (non-hydrolysing)